MAQHRRRSSIPTTTRRTRCTLPPEFSTHSQSNWMIGADWTHETGMHGYRSYGYTEATVFHSDNRSSYDGLSLRVQGNVGHRVNLTAHYTLAKAQTWGCVLGELFDYVNGVCDPNNAFAPGRLWPFGRGCAASLRACRNISDARRLPDFHAGASGKRAALTP